MRNIVLSFILILLISDMVAANDEHPLSIDIPSNYYVEAELDTVDKILYGYENIEFLNPTDKPLDKLVLHLYPNAVWDDKKISPRKTGDSGSSSGYIECDSIMINGQNPDSVVLDETLMYIFLPKLLHPGERLALSLLFKINIPRVRIRYGYDDDGNYMFAHWHPILAGYQKNELIVYQYGGEGEFFSNFANYNVRLKLPENYLFQSTASKNRPDSSVAGVSYYNLVAEGVIDFAFACGPKWRRETFYHDGITIELLYLEKNIKRLEKIKRAINGSLDYFNERFYRYPYPNLSYIDFHPGAGGMELPRMLVMSFESRYAGVDRTELTLVHETLHQWFYATVATNEFDEPWLDEGITTYYTARCLTAINGKANELEIFGFELSSDVIQAFVSRLSNYLSPLNSASDEFLPKAYYINVYTRAPAVLKTLEGVLGTEVFDNAMREFADTYKFKHPDTYDFKRTLEQSSGIDLDMFFEQFVFGTSRVDYQVSRLDSDIYDSIYTTSVEVRRDLDGVLPQNVVVGFKDGSVQSAYWDGIAKYKKFEFESTSPAVYAAIDTSYDYLIDGNFINNSLKAQPESSHSFVLSLSFMAMLQILLIIVGIV